MKRNRIPGFKETTPLAEALETWIRGFPTRPAVLEDVSIEKASGRILGENVFADRDIPPHPKSAMDGYAVRAEDAGQATPALPIVLKLVGDTPISGPRHGDLKPKEAVAVTTGSPLPHGCDAVVMVEYTRVEGERLQVFHPVHPYENVVRTGDDVKSGEKVLTKGWKLKPYDLGVLAALGFKEIPVASRPRVALMSSGDELCDGPEAGPYETVDVNRPVLKALLWEAGAHPLDYGIIEDDFEAIREKVASTLPSSDMIVITGGTSVGEGDKVPEVLNSLGRPGILVHGVSIRPGMPIGLGIIENKPVASLPGNPVAAIIGFLKLVKPAVLRMLGASDDPSPRVRAKLTRRVVSPPGFRSFVRVHVVERGGILEADPVLTLGSNIISSMVKANGILEVEEEAEGVEAGDWVEVTLYRSIIKSG